jgi:hypothetical protein
MARRSGMALFWLFGLSATAALACGPFFPLALVSNREKLLLRAPWTSFGANVSSLAAPPNDRFEVNEQRSSDGRATAQSLLAMRLSAESHGLTQDQLASLVLARAAADGDTAYVLATSLPDDVRSYTAGAVEYGRGLLDSAAARFAEVFAVANPSASLRAIWAAYMLGRIHAQQGRPRAATYWFAKVRALARGGAPDPLGLAVASYESKPEFTSPEQGSYQRLYGAMTGRRAADMVVKCRPLFFSMHSRPVEGLPAASSRFDSLQSSWPRASLYSNPL